MNRPAKQKTTVPRNIRLTEDDYELCRQAADMDKRTFSDWARLTLTAAAENQLKNALKD